MAAVVCKVGGTLSSAERRKLPADAFGLPDKRAYPITDLSHARNAKARASQQLDAGRLTRREFRQINRRADRIIDACVRPNNPHPKRKAMNTEVAKRTGNPYNPGPKMMWPWVLGGVLGVTGVALGGWWWWSRKKEPPKPTFPGVPDTPAPPEGYETTDCEQYKGRTLCVVKPLQGFPKWFAWTLDGGTPNGEHGLPPLAMAAAKEFVDSLEAEPVPPAPDGTPEATQEGQPAVITKGTAGHGITVEFDADGQCETFSVNDIGAWLGWSTELLKGLNMAAWSSQEIMDKVWSQTFAMCADKLSELPTVTIFGRPYGELVSAGQAFLNAYKDGAIGLLPGQSAESIFAGYMVGQAYVAPPGIILPVDPTSVPQFPMGPGSVLRKIKSTIGINWTIVVLPESQYYPQAAQHVFSAPWYAWSEGTVLVLSKAQHAGTSDDVDKSIEAATAAVG